ncbi:MAG: hypothetical protein HKN12_03865, partial [Gemmatimonadetes bacterium]|nr:hypothetical protein [Gemmatimonadota bacterium]
PWSAPFTERLHAGLAAAEGRTEEAAARLERAAAGFAEREFALFAAACLRTHGELTGGTGGMDKVRKADAALAAAGVRNPARFARVLVPGFSA